MLRLVAICAISAGIYGYGLGQVPAFLTLDEAHFSVHAHAIATTGRNLNGQVLPMLIGLSDPEGERLVFPYGETHYLPFGMYLIAGALQVLPLTEATVRLPSAMLGGVINVGLVFAAALALFRDRRVAWCSAIVLALAPANVIISRQALDSVCQLPFTLGFLWCLGTYLHKPHPRLALAAGAILGLGVYAYITSIIFMPFFLAVFWLIAWRANVLDRKAWAWSIGGFALALVPMIAWLAWHPDAFDGIRQQYNRADPGSATLMQTISADGIGAAVRELARLYWNYFDPSFLFVQGGNARNLSTGEVGVFLAPVLLLLAWGLARLGAYPHVRSLLLIGLLAAPIPAAIKGNPFQIQRASGLLIFVSLIAGLGYMAMWTSRRTAVRVAAVLLAVVMAWQFTGFYRDYFGRYRVRSADAYDPTAFGTAAQWLIDEERRTSIPALYLPANFYDVSAKWRFHTTKHDEPVLWRRTQYFATAAALTGAPAGSLAVWPTAFGARPSMEGWREVETIGTLSGDPTMTVLRREP